MLMRNINYQTDHMLTRSIHDDNLDYRKFKGAIWGLTDMSTLTLSLLLIVCAKFAIESEIAKICAR